MECEAVRTAMLAGGEAEWPSGVLAHLAGCDGCTAVALESSLRRVPAIAIPPAFAADVARRARLDASPETPHVRGVTAGVGAAGVLIGIVVAWLGLSGSSSGVVPATVLLLSCAEAIVLAAWTLRADVTHARWRR
jgi:hypothetical protein